MAEKTIVEAVDRGYDGEAARRWGAMEMNTDRLDRVEELFDASLRLPPEGRAAFLHDQCAGDEALRQQVERLLRHVERATGSIVVGPEMEETIDLPDHADELREKPGAKIGSYTLRELIGEGGFALVYAAEQEKPVRRLVALKIIKPGMDTRQVIARFEAERQALAMMDHPNVAKIFDAGMTEAGRPYFVMEYVAGTSITEYCDRSRLSIAERLRLFTQVCSAVQHAHQKAIIHRDIKPSNVLVSDQGGEPLVRVIDFGVAKAIGCRLTEQTIYTEQGQLIGTPEYMSPEQAEMTAENIDTRSDIYSLGVLLYEILTGALPFDSTTLRQAAFGEIQRIIREEDPPKPSTRLSSLGDESATNAQRRRADPRSLLRELRGDLDWITMKALEKDRGRRYDTATGLADDIMRHLRHEPVVAGPPSASYKLSKFVRRNRAGVAAGTVVAVGLLAAAAVSMGFAVSEARQRQIATTERDVAQAVNDFLNEDLLAAVAPSAEQGKGKDVLMRDVLDEAHKRIDVASAAGGRFEDKPLVEAAIRTTLGMTYLALAEYASAEPHLVRARELRVREVGKEDPTTLVSMDNLAVLYKQQGRYDEAESLCLEAVEIQKRTRGEEHRVTLSFQGHLAAVYREQGRFDEAESLLLDILEIGKRTLGEAHPEALTWMGNLALVYKDQGRLHEALSLALETLEIRRRALGPEHLKTLWSMSNVAHLYWQLGRYDEAEALRLEVLEIQTRVLGEEHLATLSSLGNLATLYWGQGRYSEAEAMNLRLLEIQRRVLGEEHPETLASIAELANVYWAQGRYDEAEARLAEAIELFKRVRGEEHPHTLACIGNLAMLYNSQRRYKEAEPLFLESLEIHKRVLGEEHPNTLAIMGNLAVLYEDLRRYEEAEALCLETLEIRKRVLSEEHPHTVASMASLASLYLSMERLEEAQPLCLEGLEISKRVLGEEHLYTLAHLGNVALLFEKLKRYDEAEPLYRHAVEACTRVIGREHEATVQIMHGLARLLLIRDPAVSRDPEAALALALEVNDLTGHENPEYLDTLSLAYYLTGDTETAIDNQQRAIAMLDPDDTVLRADLQANLARFQGALENPAVVPAEPDAVASDP